MTIDAYGVEDAGSFWRVWSTGSKATAFSGNQIVPVLAGSPAATGNIPNPSYTGDGSTIIAWDFQVMQTSFLPPPVPTLNSHTPRLADSIVNPNYASHAASFGFASGMAVQARVNLTRLSDSVERRIATFGTAADGAYIEFTTANTFKAVLRKGGADAVTLTSGTVSATGVYDVTVQFKAGAYSVTVSGGIAGAVSASAETLPAAIASAAYIGQSASTAQHLNGPLERLAMWGVA